jgi:hypothetical protein
MSNFLKWLSVHKWWQGFLVCFCIVITILLIIAVRSCNKPVVSQPTIKIDTVTVHVLTVVNDSLQKLTIIEKKEKAILQHQVDSLKKKVQVKYTAKNIPGNCDSVIHALVDSSNFLNNEKQINIRLSKELWLDLDIFNQKDSVITNQNVQVKKLELDLVACQKTANTNSQNQAKQTTKVSRWQKIYGYGDIILASIILGLLAAGK